MNDDATPDAHGRSIERDVILIGILAEKLGLVDEIALHGAISDTVADGGKPAPPGEIETAFDPDHEAVQGLLKLYLSGRDAETRQAFLDLLQVPWIGRLLRDRCRRSSPGHEPESAHPSALPGGDSTFATRLPDDDLTLATGGGGGPGRNVTFDPTEGRDSLLDRIGVEAPRWSRGAGSERFRSLRSHAIGGMGHVFVALDLELGREVALKEIKPEFAHRADSVARFRREAEITGQLEHPGIIPVYGLGLYPDERPFYAMRLIRGESLDHASVTFHSIKPDADRTGRALAFQQLLRRFLDVVNAVAYAHSRGVVHRDLKPANVMIGPFGETLVVDWGLAKSVGVEEPDWLDEGLPKLEGKAGLALTQAGAILGTPGYMSPEQARGEAGRVGPESDTYSLGATLYHVLTGRNPFQGQTSYEVLLDVSRGKFPAPHLVNDTVPPPLEAICLKAMAHAPEDRYATSLELARDIERWLADERVHAYREPLSDRLARWSRSHQTLSNSLLTAVIVVVLVLALVPAVMKTWVRTQPQDEMGKFFDHLNK